MSSRAELPSSLQVDLDGDVLVVHIDRPRKRNAVDDETILGLEQVFNHPPEPARAVVLAGSGDHFCAGLDLSSLRETSVADGVYHSRMWHRITQAIQFGRLPVVSVLQGAVIGGGLELASATHVRVADATAFYALPEGQHGIFVGGGGSVRLPRLIGVARMTDLMLTGRVYTAEEGHVAGISQYLVPAGDGLETGLRLARSMAQVAPLTAFAVLQALPRIADSGPHEGYLMESLMAAVAQGSDEAKARMHTFLEGRGSKVTSTTTGGPA